MLLCDTVFTGCSLEEPGKINTTYTITFNDGNGGSYEPISVKYGETINNLPGAIAPNDKEFVG